MIKCTCPDWWFPAPNREKLRELPENYMGVLRHHYDCLKTQTTRCVRCGMTPREADLGSRGKVDCTVWSGYTLCHEFMEDAFGLRSGSVLRGDQDGS